MPSQNYELIKSAIIGKKHVVATYKGHIREMCPHVIGTKNGYEQALFYQFSGTSSSATITPGSDANWRCIPISGLSNVSIKAGEWHTADNHSRSQSCVDNIDVEVDY